MADFFGGVSNPGLDFGQITAEEAALIAELESLSYSAGDILYHDGSQFQRLAVGTTGQVLTVNGAATAPEWSSAGSGNVSKVGTPANNQIGVWTGDGTLEGDADFTFDTATDTLTIAESGNIAFGAVVVLDDDGGTTTLRNIDALDATTEATIEAAIDTLANLVSIQGRTVTLADAGADAFLIWDDSANAYQNSSQADARTILGLGTAALVATDLADLNEATIESAIDTLANLTSIQGRTITLADAGANAIFGWDDTAGAYENLTQSEARAVLGLATTDSPMFTAINLGHASDTTITRVGAGVIAVEGVTVVTETSTNTLTNKTLTSPVINAATLTGNLNFSAVPASDHTANGVTMSAFNLGATVALMELVYLGSSSKWLLADADAVGTSGTVLLGICLDGGDDTDTTTVVTFGLVRDDTWNWTPGDELYVSTTAGGITATAPSGSGDVVRVIGHAVTADVIFLNPSPSHSTVV